VTDAIPVDSGYVAAQRWPRLARQGCLWFLIAILAWAPFPLGSNREWSWGLLSILVACCWTPWAIWALATSELQWRNVRLAWLPLSLALIALLWAIIQMLPIVPASWDHPLWEATANIMGQPIPGIISLNPWRTANEVAKLSTYLAAAWMAFTLAQNEDRAKLLLNAWIVIGTLYAGYAFAIALTGTQQFRIFYPLGSPLTWLSGPFVQRNSFATYEGLAAIAAIVRLVEFGHKKILTTNGPRRLVQTALKFILGAGAPLVIAATLTVSALIASASRAGFFSLLVALAAMATIVAARPGRERRWQLLATASAIAAGLLVLAWISGGMLNERLIDLADAQNADEIRRALWGATLRMIDSAPLLGLGLGTFQDAYPMYATQIFPYIMDKAHNDYLEFAAGLGLPAATAWWSALSWLVGKFVQGVLKRRKNKIYPLLGFGATILIAVHSLADFSLQIPAVSITYAVLLGVAFAQSFSTRDLAKSAQPGDRQCLNLV
jgi:O-antigen ligase